MPTYEYRCNGCGKDFEYQQKMADPDLTKCEACGEDKLEKLISWSAFQLKGGGWYKDLYSKQTPEQQRQVARESVDKGVPPKQKKDTPAASSDSSSSSSSSGESGGSSSSSSSSSDSGGGSGGGTAGGGSASAAAAAPSKE